MFAFIVFDTTLHQHPRTVGSIHDYKKKKRKEKAYVYNEDEEDKHEFVLVFSLDSNVVVFIFDLVSRANECILSCPH